MQRYRYVIGVDAALRLFREKADLPEHSALLAPTLLRSQVLSHLYASVRRGAMDRKTADAQLDRMRALKIRLLGDRVLQKRAWDIAAQLGWEDTSTAEYIALTTLQADAFVTLDETLAAAVRHIVPVAPIDQVLGKR